MTVSPNEDSARRGGATASLAESDRAFLAGLSGGDEATAEALFESVYEELRDVAEGYFRQSRRDDTLQPTALVHEVYLRLARSHLTFQSRQHFMAVAATAMRQILIDRERRRRSQKRGGDATRVTITSEFAVPATQAGHDDMVDLLALDSALNKLARLSERQARIVELLSFGGLTVEEAAETLQVSFSLAEKEWRRARAWLRRELATSSE